MDFNKLSEEKLIEMIRKGDRYAFEILIGNNISILKGYVLKLTCNKDLTEDIVQDTLLSAVINIDSFTPKAKFSSWLIKIATNKYRDYLRKNKETDILLDIIPDSHSLEEEIINKNEIEEVLKILKEMNVDISVDINSLVEKGQEIRFKKKLKKETFKFLNLAVFLSSLFGIMCVKLSIFTVLVLQFILLIFLIILNHMILKREVRG